MKFFFPEHRKKDRKKKKSFKAEIPTAGTAAMRHTIKTHQEFISNSLSIIAVFLLLFHPHTHTFTKTHSSTFSKNDEMKLKGDGKFMQIYIATLKMFYSNESRS